MMRTRDTLALMAIAVLIAAFAGCRDRPVSEVAVVEAEVEAQAEPLTERKVVTLCYHAMAEASGSTYELAIADFREQLQLLADEGFESVLPSQIADYLEGRGDLPERAVCITFDDGPASILTVSKPAMDAHGFVGAAFLIADSVGAGGNLTWDQVRELEAAGWEIGSHTAQHERPTKIDAEALRAELSGSRETIREQIDGDCDALAYPFGLYDAGVVERARDAGYRIAFTIDRGPADQTTDPMLVPRQMLVDGNSLRTFRGWLEQEKLHLEEIAPAIGERVSTDVTITARLADEDVAPGALEMSVNGRPVSHDSDSETGVLTIRPELSEGANNLRVNFHGSPRREFSWLIVAE
ncbi:MAG: polysaccharide deacetylase family protein [Armatimonadota bacterium]|jgi:peptidoglycan/xylan/chitin deacetylase (PgdA/CDA1 family)